MQRGSEAELIRLLVLSMSSMNLITVFNIIESFNCKYRETVPPRSQQELLPSESSSVDGETPVSSQTRDSLEREESVNNLRTTGVSTEDLVGDVCDDNESKRNVELKSVLDFFR